jgi:lipopolysaccharide exporter
LRQDFSVILFGAVARTGLVAALVPEFGLMGAAVGVALSLVLEPLAYLVLKSRVLPFSARALAGVVIRPSLAAAGMAAVVSRLDLAKAATSETVAGLILPLAVAVLVGAVSYAGVMLGLWLIAGKPAGAEADLLAALGKLRRTRQVAGPAAL